MPYNYEQALKDGVPEEEIAKHLAATRNYRLDDAVKAGVPYREVIEYLAPQKSIVAKPTVQEALPKPIVEKSPTPLVPERTVSPITPPGLINPNLMKPIERPKPSPMTAVVARETPAEAGVDLSGFPKEEPIPSHEPVKPTPKVPPVVEPKVVTSPFAARHPYLAAIPPTALEVAKFTIPFGKYAGEEGRAELKGDFFPPGTTTDPEKLKEIEKELVTGKKKISPYESLAKETMTAAEWAAFPTAMRAAGTIAEEVLPAVLTRFLKTPIGPWLRSLTNKERGLVTQSLEDMMNKGYSEGDVLRRWNNPSWREEALRRRNKGEEYPPFAEAGKPAESPQITPPGMAPEVPEVVGSTIPAPGTPAVQPATEIKAGAQLALPPGQGFQLMEPKPKTILRLKAPVGTEFKINPITGEPEPVRPPGIGTETPEPVGTTMPPASSIAPRPEAPPIEAPQPILPMGVGPIALPPQPTPTAPPIQAPIPQPIPQMMGMGQQMPTVAKPKENIITEIARKDMEEAAKLPPEEFPIMEATEPLAGQEVSKEGMPVSEEGVINYDSLFNRFKSQVPNQSTDYFEVEGHKVYKVEEVELPKGVEGTGLGSTNDAEGNIYLRKDLSRQGFQRALDHELRHHKEKGFEETVNLADMVGKQPWEMTKKEFVDRSIDPSNPEGTLDKKTARSLHQYEVQDAVEKGKPVSPEVLADYPDLQSLATQAIPPTAQHLELMPEEYPEIDKVAVMQDGKVYTDSVHGQIIADEGLDPEKAISGYTMKKTGEFVPAEKIEGAPAPIAPIEKPALSPTAKDQFALPGIKQGLEMKGAKEGATPTLEGTPLGEAGKAAVQAEREKAYPRLPFAEPLGEELAGTIRELQGIIKSGEAGGVLAEGEGRYGSSMKIQQMLGGISAGKEETIKAINKGLNGEKLGLRQQQIFERVKQTANAIIQDRAEADLWTSKKEAIQSLTASVDNEIMGWKEEQRGKGISEENITRRLGEAQKTIETEEGPPDLEAIKKALTESETSPVVKEPLAEISPADLHTQVNAKEYKKEGPVTAFIVDGDLIRKNIDEEFTNFSYHQNSPYIPENEIWLDKEIKNADYGYLLDNATKQRQLMSEGKSYDEALKQGNAIEQRERTRDNPPQKSDKKLNPQLIEDAKKQLLGTIGKDKTQVWLVDGDMIRKVDSSWTEGGNDGAYKWFPKNTVAVDDQISPEERTAIIVHEGTERDRIINQGMKYPDAHKLSSQDEHEYREDPAKFEASKKFAGVKLEPAPVEEKAGNWKKGESRPFTFDPNSTENEGRFRLLPSTNIKGVSYFRRKSRTNGVSYIMGKDKTTGDEVTQAIRFNKAIMPEEKAAKWWEENKGRFPFSDVSKIELPEGYKIQEVAGKFDIYRPDGELAGTRNTEGDAIKYAQAHEKEFETKEISQMKGAFDESKIKKIGITEAIKKLKSEIESSTGRKLADDALAEVRVPKSGKAISELGRTFGKKVVFFDTKEVVSFNGIVIPEEPDTIYLHIKSSAPHLFVIGHELIHTLKSEQPTLYKKFIDATDDLIQDFSVYRVGLNLSKKQSGMPRFESAEEVKEELYADFSGQQFMNKDFWNILHDREPSLFKKVVNVAKNIIDRIVKRLGKLIPLNNRFFKDIKKAQSNLADAMGKYAAEKVQIPPVYSAIPFAIPAFMGRGENDKKRVHPPGQGAPSYLPPGMGL
jgi:hypothetical protein